MQVWQFQTVRLWGLFVPSEYKDIGSTVWVSLLDTFTEMSQLRPAGHKQHKLQKSFISWKQKLF